MKKLIFISLLSVSTLLAFAQSVSTDETTDVGIEFKSDGTNTEGNGPFKDNLAIIWKPTAFDFGQQKAVAGVSSFVASPTSDGNWYLAVNDDRAENKGKGGAWTVKAGLSKMVNKDGETLESTLNIKFDEVQSYDLGKVSNETNTDYVPNNPNDANVVTNFTEANKNPGFQKADVVLTAGATSAQTVLSKTASNDGGGVAAKISTAQLTVMNAQAGKAYSGTVTWAFDNTPAV